MKIEIAFFYFPSFHWKRPPFFFAINIFLLLQDALFQRLILWALFLIVTLSRYIESSTFYFAGELVFESISIPRIYPNPVKDELTIQMMVEEILEQVSVLDVVAREVYFESEINLSGSTYPLNCSSLSSAAYFMTINNTGKAQRFIVE